MFPHKNTFFLESSLFEVLGSTLYAFAQAEASVSLMGNRNLKTGGDTVQSAFPKHSLLLS